MNSGASNAPVMATGSEGVLASAPKALLLDFGGVIFLTTKHANGRDDYVAKLNELLARSGNNIDPSVLRQAIDSGLTALKHWKHASSRRRAPREMGHREIVGDFLAADLPDQVRATLVAEAQWVLEELTSTLSGHALRPGILELIAQAKAAQVPLVIVSNAHSGASHRKLLRAHGIYDDFVAQIYSDEVGMRKPNPRMLTLAAEAAGVDIADCWYVGDTLDRDVVTGRNAGAGGVFITASQHSNNPPFAVMATPDAVFDTPEGLLAAFRYALGNDSQGLGAHGTELIDPPRQLQPRAALFLDHGGVISISYLDRTRLEQFAQHLSALLGTLAEPLTDEHVLNLLNSAKREYKERKAHLRAQFDLGQGSLQEVTPKEFWVEFFGSSLSPRQRAILAIEAFDLTAQFGRAKSKRILRPGVRELLLRAQDLNMPVVVVSNTISGRAVRMECAAHGLTQLIGAYVTSDEVGLRKPEIQILAQALEITRGDPAKSWFVGDKPQNDALVAQELGVSNRVLVRGGSTADALLDQALQQGLATHVVTSMTELSVLLHENAATLLPLG